MGFKRKSDFVFFSVASIWSKVESDEAQHDRGWSGVEEITLNRLI